MQTRYNNLEELHEFLVKMKGIEYDVIHTNADASLCFIIRKQNRMSKTDVVPIAVYYIIEGTVYQAPDVYSVLGSRIETSLFHLDQAFNMLISRSTFQPSRGYGWKGEHEYPTRSMTTSTSRNVFTRREIQEMRQRVDNLATHLYTVPPIMYNRKRNLRTQTAISEMDNRKQIGSLPQQTSEDEKGPTKPKTKSLGIHKEV
jgi:mediator of RNA polymerase II transcription subunit 6